MYFLICQIAAINKDDKMIVSSIGDGPSKDETGSYSGHCHKHSANLDLAPGRAAFAPFAKRFTSVDDEDRCVVG